MQHHTCWRCPHPIMPGDEYYCEVLVTDGDGVPYRNRLTVWKMHKFCPDDRYEDEEEKECKEDEDRGKELSSDTTAA